MYEHFILLRVEFENGLFILILKNRTDCYKNLPLEIEKFLKSQICSKAARPLYFAPPDFFKCVATVEDAVHLYVSTIKLTGADLKEKSHGDGFKYVLLTG
jgi:hypothetical protein